MNSLATDQNSLPLWLTAQETADLLRVHYNTIYEMVKQGKLPGRKVGRSWRINRDALFADLRKSK